MQGGSSWRAEKCPGCCATASLCTASFNAVAPFRHSALQMNWVVSCSPVLSLRRLALLEQPASSRPTLGHVYRQIYRNFWRAARTGKFLGNFCALCAQANFESNFEKYVSEPNSEPPPCLREPPPGDDCIVSGWVRR